MKNFNSAKPTNAIIENLQQQDIALSTKLAATQIEQHSQHQELGSATANRDAIEKRHILDQASDAEVILAQQLFEELTAKLAATNRRIDLIKTARSELVPKIAAAQRDYEIARRAHLQEMISELSTELNSKIRSQILAIRAAECLTGIQYPGQWDLVLKRIFPQASFEEIGSATLEFAEKHKLDH